MTATAQGAEPPISLIWDGTALEAPARATIGELSISQGCPTTGEEAPVAAVLDGRLVSLDHVLYEGAEVRPVHAREPVGREVYRRSLNVVLQAALRDVFPGVRLVVGQSQGGGYYHDWEGDPGITDETVRSLEQAMVKIVEEDLPIELVRVGEREALRLFRSRGMRDRVLLLNTWWHESVRLVRLGDYYDIRHGPVAPNTGRLPFFSLRTLRDGLLLRFPGVGHKGSPRGEPKVVAPLFDVFRETKEWNRILGIETVGGLNAACLSGEVDGIIHVAEGLHEQKVVHIAEDLCRSGSVKLALIAGPSSSGKTTFSKRLSVQLRVLGVNPVSVSVDDYYVNREDTPLDRDGEYDFEAIEAVDLDLFNSHLENLTQGREVRVPRFHFASGKRVPEDQWVPMKLGEKDVLVVEGIHALNPRLSEIVSDEVKFNIYVSALTQLCLDDANRISTTDVRLLRRVVRDRLFRGYSVNQTLSKWPSVKRGEARNIFPFQDRADVMFNSTLVYELAVLKIFAQRYLLEVMHGEPEFLDAYRLLKFLDLFIGVSPDMVPRTSIIREFIGGSHFEY
ncbi:MAG: nucleoside kinase [Deltaproteobacteria bacterium]|nr:nucleoside kinase [Deltaproteobacteria bacterium]